MRQIILILTMALLLSGCTYTKTYLVQDTGFQRVEQTVVDFSVMSDLEWIKALLGR